MWGWQRPGEREAGFLDIRCTILHLELRRMTWSKVLLISKQGKFLCKQQALGLPLQSGHLWLACGLGTRVHLDTTKAVDTFRVLCSALFCRDAEGRACLHYAAGYGHEECVDLLLAKGAEPRSV
jgi:hypothetical protein